MKPEEINDIINTLKTMDLNADKVSIVLLRNTIKKSVDEYVQQMRSFGWLDDEIFAIYKSCVTPFDSPEGKIFYGLFTLYVEKCLV
jgi:hypothetical protein